MALPIFGYFMRSVYADKKIDFYRGEFDRPSVPLGTELDCTLFQREVEAENAEGRNEWNGDWW